jgi:hypothetical protein
MAVTVDGVLDRAAGDHVATVVTRCWEELGGAVVVDLAAATFVPADAADAVARASGAVCARGGEVRVHAARSVVTTQAA